MIKDDGRVINFNNPTVQASLSANTFAITGHSEEKHFTELLPGILNHLGAEGFNHLKRHASSMAQGKLIGSIYGSIYCFSLYMELLSIIIYCPQGPYIRPLVRLVSQSNLW